MGCFVLLFFNSPYQALVLEVLLTVTENEGGNKNQSDDDYFIAGIFYEDMYFS